MASGRVGKTTDDTNSNSIYSPMEKMQRVRQSIMDYIQKNGQEYDRLLISEDFLEQLQREAAKNNKSSRIDLPRMEVKSDVDYDFKLLP